LTTPGEGVIYSCTDADGEVGSGGFRVKIAPDSIAAAALPAEARLVSAYLFRCLQQYGISVRDWQG
jgi:hypothetical protein